MEQTDQIEKMDEIELRINNISIQNSRLKSQVSSYVSDYEENKKILENNENYLSLVGELSDKVKTLALNLAINLAKSKRESFLFWKFHQAITT